MLYRVFDGHCDTPVELWLQEKQLRSSDLAVSLDKAAGLGGYAQFFAFCTAWIKTRMPHTEHFSRALDYFLAQLRKNEDRITLCRTAPEAEAAMQAGKQGAVRDFVAVGDLDIKVIGADNQVLDSEVPVRQILEQVVAKTGIPPFMLGLTWSSTERMSSQQADLLTTEITAIRRTVTPAVERICRLWLRMHGYPGSVEALWDEINLQDEVEEAKAALYLQQARKLRQENDEAEGK